jgi:hypothetical protein
VRRSAGAVCARRSWQRFRRRSRGKTSGGDRYLVQAEGPSRRRGPGLSSRGTEAGRGSGTSRTASRLRPGRCSRMRPGGCSPGAVAPRPTLGAASRPYGHASPTTSGAHSGHGGSAHARRRRLADRRALFERRAQTLSLQPAAGHIPLRALADTIKARWSASRRINSSRRNLASTTSEGDHG